jgi:hypothetical protein
MTPSGSNNQSFLLRIAPASLHLEEHPRKEEFRLKHEGCSSKCNKMDMTSLNGTKFS